MKVIDDHDFDDDAFDDFDDDQRKNRKKPTLFQTIDQVMTIKTHTESSKTELSSRGKRPFKVWRFFSKFLNFHAAETLKNSKKFLKIIYI